MTYRNSEKSLVRRAIKRDVAAFTELYWRNVDRVYRHVFYRVRHQNAAEDISQETFMRAWKALDRYRDRGHTFGAWLIAIADNRTADYFKANPANVALDENVLERREAKSKERIDFTDDHNDVREAISLLPEEKQKVVLMRYIEGFSFSEIARVLKKSEGAVRVILHRSLRELRDHLGR
ncbi:MAG: hypothetical protein A2Y92_02660 [Chloroflexi bacterium RBG_13_57_8]|nr:MAG: hypothetical protein A2Y92_02660 [Chloroflexi bacterium RBG_13_57_8]